MFSNKILINNFTFKIKYNLTICKSLSYRNYLKKFISFTNYNITRVRKISLFNILYLLIHSKIILLLLKIIPKDIVLSICCSLSKDNLYFIRELIKLIDINT